MPLKGAPAVLNRSNAVSVMLTSFQRNPSIKALIFMPGATDEFYFFKRAEARLTNTSPTLLDAVVALTNQTWIQVTEKPPFLLLHTIEDPLELSYTIEHEPTLKRIQGKRFVKTAIYNDQDWDSIHPILSFNLDTRMLPGLNSGDSCHFYRSSFTAYDLTGWEALEVVAYAEKTTFKIKKKTVVFEGDSRRPQKPSVEGMKTFEHLGFR
jgi:hypothetical protein